MAIAYRSRLVGMFQQSNLHLRADAYCKVGTLVHIQSSTGESVGWWSMRRQTARSDEGQLRDSLWRIGYENENWIWRGRTARRKVRRVHPYRKACKKGGLRQRRGWSERWWRWQWKWSCWPRESSGRAVIRRGQGLPAAVEADRLRGESRYCLLKFKVPRWATARRNQWTLQEKQTPC